MKSPASALPSVTVAAATPLLPRAEGRHAHWIAVGYVSLTSACFASLDTLSKYTAEFAPVTQTLWMRYAVQAVLMSLWWAIWLRPTTGWVFFRTRHPRFHVLRALLLAACTVVCFIGLRYLPVGEFTAVSFLSPMIAMVASGWLLREPMARAQWLFALLAFVGGLIVIRPGAGIFGWPVLFAVVVALLNAGFQLVTRKLASLDEHPVLAQWIAGWVGTVALTVPLFWPGSWRFDLAPVEWLVLVAIGAFGTMGHFFLMKAFALDTAPALAPYTYVQIVFAMFGGWLLFAHAPDGWALIGMVVIMASGFASGLQRARRTALPRRI